MKNMTNNTMYIVKELHAFASNGIAFSGIATNRTANCIQSLIIKHFVSINVFATFLN